MGKNTIVVIKDKNRNIAKKKNEWIAKMGQYGFFCNQEDIFKNKNIVNAGKVIK